MYEFSQVGGGGKGYISSFRDEMQFLHLYPRWNVDSMRDRRMGRYVHVRLRQTHENV